MPDDNDQRQGGGLPGQLADAIVRLSAVKPLNLFFIAVLGVLGWLIVTNPDIAKDWLVTNPMLVFLVGGGSVMVSAVILLVTKLMDSTINAHQGQLAELRSIKEDLQRQLTELRAEKMADVRELIKSVIERIERLDKGEPR